MSLTMMTAVTATSATIADGGDITAMHSLSSTVTVCLNGGVVDAMTCSCACVGLWEGDTCGSCPTGNLIARFQFYFNVCRHRKLP